MKFADAVDFALASLRKRRLRTFLTAAGVMIGIGALVSMIAFGRGMQKNVTRVFEASDLFTSVTVLPGGQDSPGTDPDGRGLVRKGPAGATALLDDAAVAALGAIPGVVTAFPDIGIPAMVGYGGQEEFRLVQVIPAAVAASHAVKIKWGRAYATDDENGVVVREGLLRRLGEKGDPGSAVGKTIRITTVSIDFGQLASLNLGAILAGQRSPFSQESYEFPIVGVSEASVFGPDMNLTEGAVMLPPGPAKRIKRLPFSSVWDLFRMRDGKLGYGAVSVRLRSLGDLDRVRTRIHEMGFATFALADQFEEITKGFYLLDTALAAVGMIAIVVAALGIVNTMIMSILERYREIGVMKAVGASDRDIRRIFFFESGTIGFLGGAAGCVLGWAVSLVINRIVNFYAARQGGMPFVDYFAFPVWLFLGAIGFAILVSLVSGIYPARRAARVDPVVALRHD